MAPKHQSTESRQQAGRPTTRVVNVSSVEARVDRVMFEGVQRTKDDVLKHLAKPLIEGTGTFDQLLLRASLLRTHLMSMNGSFKEAIVTIDAKEGINSPNGYDVTVTVEESANIAGHVTTTLESSRASTPYPGVQSALRLPNLLGRGETISFEYTKTKSEALSGFSFTASKPWIFHVPDPIDSTSLKVDPSQPRGFPLISASLFKGSSEFPLSGLHQSEKGVSFDLLTFPSHNFSWRTRLEGNMRNMSSCLTGVPDNPVHIQHHSGEFTKLSLKSIIDFDNREFDHRTWFPSNGIRASLTKEFAGLVGNQAFIKHEGAVEINAKIPRTRILLQACMRAGLLFDQQGLSAMRTGRFPALSERFFVGGPLTLRGFGHFGIGPRTPPMSVQAGETSAAETRFALGSDLYWTGGVHAYLPLPFISSPTAPPSSFPGIINRCLRLHLFANAGVAADIVESVKSNTSGTTKKYNKKELLNAIVREVQNDVRTSVGVGVAVQAGQHIRFEINYAKPLRFNRQNDITDEGFQFGFGVHFN